ncbi:MAG: hypothetical protein FJ100_17890 [Deltaproteobacteria bacterium]|nr:hypothetical protein [Deltaproteobacteria bacterium]
MNRPRIPFPWLLLTTWLAAATGLAAEGPPAAAPSAARQWRFGHLRFVATDSGTLQTWNDRGAAPQMTDERDLGGPVVDVRVEAGVLVAVVLAPRPVLLRVDAAGQVSDYRVAGLAGAATAIDWAPRPPRSDEPDGLAVGEVTAVANGDAEVQLRRTGALVVGQAALLRPVPGKGPDGEATLLRQPVVGQVARVHVDRAWIELPRGAAIEVGDSVERTIMPPQTYRFQVPRPAYDTWVSAWVRPVLPLRDLGAQVGFELGVGSGGLAIVARGAPVTLSNANGISASLLDLSLLYDADYFAVGAGGGLGRSKHDDCFFFNNGLQTPQCVAENPWRWAGSAEVRLGSRDGGHLHLRAALGETVGFDTFAQFDGQAVVPVSRLFDFRAAWTARSDIQFFEVGGRTYLRGVGEAGTMLLTFGVGGIEVDQMGGDLEGPSVTFGVEWRR